MLEYRGGTFARYEAAAGGVAVEDAARFGLGTLDNVVAEVVVLMMACVHACSSGVLPVPTHVIVRCFHYGCMAAGITA